MARFRRRTPVVEALEADPSFPVPARFNFTRDVVEAAAAADAYRHAMTFVDHEGIIDRRRYKEIAQDASRWTSLFRARGLEPGDRIVVLVGRTPLWHSVVLGALKGGFVAVPCSMSLTADELMQRSRQCDARAIVTDRGHAPSAPESVDAVSVPAPRVLLIVEDLKEELRRHSVEVPTADTSAGDPALILFTAGTTGAPKGAIHTHASTWAMRLQAEQWLDARRDDLVWCTADTGSALFVWGSLIGPWSVGCEIALHELEFAVEERFDLIGRLGATVLCQPASEYRLMAEHMELERVSFGSVRHAVSTGASLDPTVVEAFRDAFGVTIRNGYGQTETGLIVANRRDAEIGIGSLGTPIPGYDIALIDDGGTEVGVGAEGEIAVLGRPPTHHAAYLDDLDATDAAFLGEWYLTGDRATRDADGCFWFAGRGDGTISSRRAAQQRAAAAVAVEQARRDAEERTRKAHEERRLEEERATAAAVHQHPEVAAEPEPPAEPLAPTRRSRSEESAARRAAKAEAKEAERQTRADEKRRRDEQKAAAEQARRDDAAAKRAAKIQAREEEEQRKADDKRRRDEEKAAAEQNRRDEAEAARAASSAAPDPTDADDDIDERVSADLIARLRAYGRGDGSEDAIRNEERDG